MYRTLDVQRLSHTDKEERIILARCAADGSSDIAYLPSYRAITVSGACLTGAPRWQPRSERFPPPRRYIFTPPTSSDWVLVVDSSVASFSAPGGSIDLAEGEVLEK
jgi:hypothetical protein